VRQGKGLQATKERALARINPIALTVQWVQKQGNGWATEDGAIEAPRQSYPHRGSSVAVVRSGARNVLL
jgi:hypothetical protein